MIVLEVRKRITVRAVEQHELQFLDEAVTGQCELAFDEGDRFSAE
jgi:hypothetical protein